MLTGTRNDEYMKQNPEKLEVEIEKTGKVAGKYIRPELYGVDASQGALNRTAVPTEIKGVSSDKRKNQ